MAEALTESSTVKMVTTQSHTEISMLTASGASSHVLQTKNEVTIGEHVQELQKLRTVAASSLTKKQNELAGLLETEDSLHSVKDNL